MLLSHQYPNQMGHLVIALLLAWGGTFVILLQSSLFLRLLGEKGVNALERLMGLILVTIGNHVPRRHSNVDEGVTRRVFRKEPGSVTTTGLINLTNSWNAIIPTMAPTVPRMVSIMVQVFSVSASVAPVNLPNNQKPASLTWLTTIEPPAIQIDSAAICAPE